MGGGIGMGNTCKPLAVSFQCMTKSTTNKNKKKKETEKKIKLESLIGFLSANKIDNYKGGGKTSKRIYRRSQKIRIINVFIESLLCWESQSTLPP